MKTSHILFLFAALASAAVAGVKIDPGNMSPYSKTKVSAKLYTPPDETASGGIKGKIVEPPSEVLGVMAMPQRYSNIAGLDKTKAGQDSKNRENIKVTTSNPVYLAKLNADGSFEFSGLPAGKYDLFVMCEDSFYEGFMLSRETTTLTEGDRKSITAKMLESNPFFNVKLSVRMEGSTGQYGVARAIEQQVRTLPVTLQDARVLDFIQIRAIKLCFYECVAPAKIGGLPHWEMRRTREITRQEVGPPDFKGPIQGNFCSKLRNIRVVRSIKDLGEIKLTTDPVPVIEKTTDSQLEPAQN